MTTGEREYSTSMGILDLRSRPDRDCYGCGQIVDGPAVEVWASTSGPIAAMLCDDCAADVAVCERLAGDLAARPELGRGRIAWATDDLSNPLAFAPATEAAIFERLTAGKGFSFSH
jgi:hypothetical protein